MTHELKIWNPPFEEILAGKKRYEIRKADRPFTVGDEVWLREWVKGYTGRELFVVITHVTKAGSWGLPDDLCVFGFRLRRGR